MTSLLHMPIVPAGQTVCPPAGAVTVAETRVGLSRVGGAAAGPAASFGFASAARAVGGGAAIADAVRIGRGGRGASGAAAADAAAAVGLTAVAAGGVVDAEAARCVAAVAAAVFVAPLLDPAIVVGFAGRAGLAAAAGGKAVLAPPVSSGANATGAASFSAVTGIVASGAFGSPFALVCGCSESHAESASIATAITAARRSGGTRNVAVFLGDRYAASLLGMIGPRSLFRVPIILRPRRMKQKAKRGWPQRPQPRSLSCDAKKMIMSQALRMPATTSSTSPTAIASRSGTARSKIDRAAARMMP